MCFTYKHVFVYAILLSIPQFKIFSFCLFRHSQVPSVCMIQTRMAGFGFHMSSSSHLSSASAANYSIICVTFTNFLNMPNSYGKTGFLNYAYLLLLLSCWKYRICISDQGLVSFSTSFNINIYLCLASECFFMVFCFTKEDWL